MMKRLKRRSRPTNRGSTRSLSCLPRALLCRAWTPPSSRPITVLESPVFDARSRVQKSSGINDVNHRTSDVLEQSRKNGGTTTTKVNDWAALLGGSAHMQQYTRFITTLLRERAAIRGDGVPLTTINHQTRTAHVNRSRPIPSPTRRRVRTRQSTTNRLRDDPANINESDNDDGLLVEETTTELINKPAERRTLLRVGSRQSSQSSVGTGDDAMNAGLPVDSRRPETEFDVCSSAATVTEAGSVTRGMSMTIVTMECSPRQRRRRTSQLEHSGIMNDNRQSSHRPRSKKSVTAKSQTQVDPRGDCNLSAQSVHSLSEINNHSGEISRTDVDVAQADRRQRRSWCDDVDKDGARLDRVNRPTSDVAALQPRVSQMPLKRADERLLYRHRNCGSVDEIFAFHFDSSEEFSKVTRWQCPGHVDRCLSPGSTPVNYYHSELLHLPLRSDKIEVNRHAEGALGLDVDEPTIPFIDCDTHRVEESFEQNADQQACLGLGERLDTSSTSIAIDSDRRRKAGDELSPSRPRAVNSPQRASRTQVTAAESHLGGVDVVPPCSRCTVSCQAASRACQSSSAPARMCRRCRCHSLQQPSVTDTRSQTAGSTFHQTHRAQLARDEAHPSQLLMATCRCSIKWTNIASTLHFAVSADTYAQECSQSRQPTVQNGGLANSRVISNTPGFNPRPDMKHLSLDRRQQTARRVVTLPSNSIRQFISNDEGRIAMEEPGADGHCVRVYWVAVRCRRGSRRTSKCCLLTTKFLLTRLQTNDQTTTYVCAHRTPADLSTDTECYQVDGGDFEAPNLPLRRCCSCSTGGDVISDDYDDAMPELAPDCSVSDKPPAISQPGAMNRTFDVARTPTSSVDGVTCDVVDDVTPGCIVDDVSQSLTTYEFAEVTSIFRNFAADLLPKPAGRELSVVTSSRRRWNGRSSMSQALVRRLEPGMTYNAALVPYSQHIFVPLPLMTWSWNHRDEFTTAPRRTRSDVTHIPYVSACTEIDIEPSVDSFTLITTSSDKSV